MATATTIAMIGATSTLGAALCTDLSRGPVRLLLMDEDDAALRRLSGRLKKVPADAEIVRQTCAVEACWEADQIWLLTSCPAQLALAARIGPVTTRKLLVSVTAEPAATGLMAALQARLPYALLLHAQCSLAGDGQGLCLSLEDQDPVLSARLMPVLLRSMAGV